MYDKVAGPVYGLVASVLDGDRTVSGEVAQAVLVEVWRSAGQYDPGRGPAPAWVCALAHRRAVEQKRCSSTPSHRVRHQDLPSWLPDGLAAGGNPGHQSERERTRYALQALPDSERTALVLAYYQGMTLNEVSQHLQEPVGTVAARLRDALQHLHQAL
ncbi:sigma-70 family RNA polymerase sigma factor [Streptomyces sp. NPDC058613]|uniref:sigma-70 family RNA polymerase sigma factor n=1 Tax=unclassified Streptomyces TaxID=2593676 RepID=UPI00365C6801